MSGAGEALLKALMKAIADGNATVAGAMLADAPGLARQRVADGASRQSMGAHYLAEIGHYLYAGDTALHIAGGESTASGDIATAEGARSRVIGGIGWGAFHSL